MRSKSLFIPLFLVSINSHGQEPLENNQWYLNSNKQYRGANIKKAWEVIETQYRPKVAIIDAGFDINHEDLKESILINEGEIPDNGIDDDLNGYVDDYYGYNTVKKNGQLLGDYDFQTKHGTAVAGIIAAGQENRVGIKGIAQGIKIIPIVRPEPMAKRKDKLPYLIEAFKYAIKRKADIINFSARLNVTSSDFKNILKELNDQGIILFASAGNTGSVSSTKRYPESYEEEFDNIIIVGSSDMNGNKAKSSSYNKDSVHIFAPGEQILTTHPENNYGYSSGTSFSTPIAAGVAALILTHHGKDARWSMRERLINTCQKVKSLEGLSVSNGIIDAYQALK
ncbi:S8 family serine peptidase [Bacteriovorax sp. Seq25_V]|uniref:S8 family serine peptidase n=1 Tax=Bacteriovorax sp. Seq25_V TaxID=1201288 RepID=UPI000389EFE2|nr:S8 family serine peptidase [Bacteriovorax sp. Seq25_V]EQC47678.1 peptidase, S8/S53 family [Bacteriovorax sp. Seq25_V]